MVGGSERKGKKRKIFDGKFCGAIGMGERGKEGAQQQQHKKRRE